MGWQTQMLQTGLRSAIRSRQNARMSAKSLLEVLFAVAFLFSTPCANGAAAKTPGSSSALQKRWLFVWRNMNDPKEVDRVLALLPRAAAAGYNGVVLSH